MTRRLIILLLSIIWLVWGIAGNIVSLGLSRCPYYSVGENAFCPIVETISNSPLIYTWIIPYGLVIALAFMISIAILIDRDIKENKNFNFLASALLIFFLGGVGSLIYLGYTQLKGKTSKKIVDQDL